MHQATTTDQLPCACTALRKATRAVSRLYDDLLGDSGMTVVQFSILRNVARNQPVSLMQLARLLVMERTTLYRDLKPMERQGWLLMEQGNGRSKTASLTSAGRNAMLGATSAWEVAQQRLLSRVGIEEWESVQSALGRIVNAAQEAAG